MMDVMKKALYEWGQTTDSREKLQHAYLVSSMALVLAAGILGLINYDLGQKVLFVAILAIGMFFINAVAWALLQSFILLKISTNQATKKIVSPKPKKSPRIKK